MSQGGGAPGGGASAGARRRSHIRHSAKAPISIQITLSEADGSAFGFTARVRIDTLNELEYFRAGGILHYVLRKLAA